MTNVVQQAWVPINVLAQNEDTIVSRFEKTVAAFPDKLAIIVDEISLTYRALDLKATHIAAALASLPSSRNQPLVLFMRDETARIAAMLGALKSNLIFVSLAPDAPARWVNQVVKESNAASIIVDYSTHLVANAAVISGVNVIEVEKLSRSSESLVAKSTAVADDAAFVVYTSGSTGAPKGVTISHRSFLRNCDVRNVMAEIGYSDRYANLRSSGLNSGIRNSFSPLLTGACLLPFDLNRHGLQKLAPWLIAKKVTYVSLASSLLRTWLGSLSDSLRFPLLRFVGVTGERLYAGDVIRLSRHLEGDWRIGYSYSSTESGTIAAQVFTSLNLPEAAIVAVGRPVDGAEVSIKDETGAPVPFGEIGEIFVRSRFLAQGYWNNPNLTAKFFQTDPLDSAIRIYRTRDLGRWRSDGTLELVGRKGRTIRLRGYNIEPFHVESELIHQPGVTDAVVRLHEAPGQEPCLVGYVVASPGTSSSAIRSALLERLPSYMVPSDLVVLNSFPITVGGKIDLNALPPPKLKETRRTVFRNPSEEYEDELLSIWQDILGMQDIGIDDDFFELGGTSLQALSIFARIDAWLSLSLSPTTIVQAPTVARLAKFIRATKKVAGSQSVVLLRASTTGPPLFLAYDRAGLSIFYRHLATDLKTDCRVYGLQPLPLDGKHPIARTIESMASDCVSEIQRVQPRGPYFLAGFSFGGRLSFEIAQQLTGKGECVSFLGLIDTSFRNMAVEGRPWMSEALHISRKAKYADGFQDLLFRGLRFVTWQVLRAPMFIRNEIWFRRYDARIRRGRSIPHKYRPAYYERLSVRANRMYVPKPYAGHITIFSSAGNSERQRAYWATLARGGLTVIEMPAAHDDMVLPPHSKILAEHFDAALRIRATTRIEVWGPPTTGIS